MTNKTKAELEVDISKLEKQVEELQLAGQDDTANAEVPNLQARIVELEDQLRVANDEKAKALDDLQNSRGEVTKLTDYDMERETDFNNAKERADRAEKALAELTQEVDVLRHRNSELREKIETLSVRGATLHGHIDDLKRPY